MRPSNWYELLMSVSNKSRKSKNAGEHALASASNMSRKSKDADGHAVAHAVSA